MIIAIEIIICTTLFTFIVVVLTLKDPLVSIDDYPPAIKKRCIELGLISDQKKKYNKAEIIRKTVAAILFVILFSFILNKVNGINTFWSGLKTSYIIWLVIDWYDALILDCIWFCHSKRVRIKGTEDMVEYKDYLFHIKKSILGMIIGLPVCLLIGLLVTIF